MEIPVECRRGRNAHVADPPGESPVHCHPPGPVAHAGLALRFGEFLLFPPGLSFLQPPSPGDMVAKSRNTETACCFPLACWWTGSCPSAEKLVSLEIKTLEKYAPTVRHALNCGRELRWAGRACLWRCPESGLLISQSAVAHRESKDAIETRVQRVLFRGWDGRIGMEDLWHDETAPLFHGTTPEVRDHDPSPEVDLECGPGKGSECAACLRCEKLLCERILCVSIGDEGGAVTRGGEGVFEADVCSCSL